MSPASWGGPGVFLGVARLARFDARGLAAIPGNRDAFLASIAPLVAFTLVGAGLMLADNGGLPAVEEFAVTLCALLTPAVLSHVFAQVWRREGEWLRYATAFNWCQWAIPVAASLLLLVLGLCIAVGLPNRVAGIVVVAGLILYALALHWFLARHGLRLSVLRALLVVVGTNLGTALVVLLPRMAVVMAGLDS